MLEHDPLEAGGIRRLAVESEDVREHWAPRVVAGCALDRIGRSREHADASPFGHPRRLRGERRLADPGVALDDDRGGLAVGGERLDPLRDQRALGLAIDQPTVPRGDGGAHRGQAPDRHGLGSSLDRDRRELLELEMLADGPGGHLVAQDLAGAGVGQARRQVRNVAVEEVLAPQVVPEEPAERAARRHAHGARQPQRAELLAHGRRGTQRARDIVLMGARRQPEGARQGQALVVHAGLARALEQGDRLLEGPDGGLVALELLQGAADFVEQPRHHDRERAQLGQPFGARLGPPTAHRRGDEGRDRVGVDLGARRVPGGLGRLPQRAERHEPGLVELDALRAVGDARPGRCGEDDAARGRGALRHGDVVERRADRQQLPAAVDAANECDLELAGRDPDARAQPQPRVRRLEREPGLHRAHGCLGQALLVVGLPAAEERVAGGGEEVAAVPVHDLGQLHEVLVQRPRELVEAFGADAAQFLDARGPALDVGEQQRPMDR